MPALNFNLPFAIKCLKICIQAYKPEEELDLSGLGVEKIDYINNELTDTQAILVRDEKDLFVVFRGATNLKDYFTDINILRAAFPPSKKFWWFRPHVHKGFYDAYQSVREEIIDVVERELGGRRLVVTGHSLGAAIAIICSLDLKRTINTPIVMYNFGAPHIGNKAFLKLYNNDVPESYRVVNDEDIVPKLLIPGFGHVKTLVFVDNDGALTVNPNRMMQLKENLDDIPSFFSGEAIKDHLSANYLDILTKVGGGQKS